MKLQKCFGFGIQKIASDMVSGGRARTTATIAAGYSCMSAHTKIRYVLVTCKKMFTCKKMVIRDSVLLIHYVLKNQFQALRVMATQLHGASLYSLK